MHGISDALRHATTQFNFPYAQTCKWLLILYSASWLNIKRTKHWSRTRAVWSFFERSAELWSHSWDDLSISTPNMYGIFWRRKIGFTSHFCCFLKLCSGNKKIGIITRYIDVPGGNPPLPPAGRFWCLSWWSVGQPHGRSFRGRGRVKLQLVADGLMSWNSMKKQGVCFHGYSTNRP